MARELHTAEEIRTELARLLQIDPDLLPLPERLTLPSDPFDDSGANWHIPAWPNIWPNGTAVRKAILNVKARWDLKGEGSGS